MITKIVFNQNSEKLNPEKRNLGHFFLNKTKKLNPEKFKTKAKKQKPESRKKQKKLGIWDKIKLISLGLCIRTWLTPIKKTVELN